MTPNAPTIEPSEKPKAKGGAPELNRSAWRHGLYSPRSGLDLPGTTYAEREANRFRRSLEDACQAAHGAISLTNAALIHSASEMQRLAYLNRLQKHATDDADKLTPDLMIRFDDSYSRLLDLRDKKIAGLDLPKPTASSTSDVWNAFTLPAIPEPPSGLSSDAPASAGEPLPTDPQPARATAAP